MTTTRSSPRRLLLAAAASALASLPATLDSPALIAAAGITATMAVTGFSSATEARNALGGGINARRPGMDARKKPSPKPKPRCYHVPNASILECRF